MTISTITGNRRSAPHSVRQAFDVLLRVSPAKGVSVFAHLAVAGGCEDTDESKPTARGREHETTSNDSESKAPPIPNNRMKPKLHELNLDNKRQIDEFLTLIGSNKGYIRIYFHIHDEDYRYSDFYAWVCTLEDGYEYNLSGHGSATTHVLISNQNDLLSRIKLDNSQYSHLELMHYAADVNATAEQDGAVRPATTSESKIEGGENPESGSEGHTQEGAAGP